MHVVVTAVNITPCGIRAGCLPLRRWLDVLSLRNSACAVQELSDPMQVTWVRPPFPLRDNKKMLPRPQKASVRFWKCKWTENSVAWRHKRIIIIQMWLDICILKCFHPIINYQKAGRKGMKIISGRGKIKSKYFKTSHSTKFTWRQTSTFHLNCFRIAVIFFFWLRFFFGVYFLRTFVFFPLL